MTLLLLKDRLKEAMKGPPTIKPADLARACSIKQPSVSDWLSGRTKHLEGANLLNAARALRVRPEWLATGKGHMRPGDAQSADLLVQEPDATYHVEVKSSPALDLSSEELALVEFYRQSGPEIRELLHRMMGTGRKKRTGVDRTIQEHAPEPNDGRTRKQEVWNRSATDTRKPKNRNTG